ncbi:MAG: hypothetical protein V1720_15630 [bacterium]
MKKITFTFSLLLMIGTNLFSQQTDFTKLTGKYFGQKLPGVTPEIFAPGIISTGLEEAICTFMPDGNEIVFNILYSKPHHRGVYSALVRSYIQNGIWSYPGVMKLSGDKYAYLYPFISYDGKELFFQSDLPTNRPELKDKYNIWRCKRIEGAWSEPEPLPLPINGRGDVSGPSLSLNGEFYFTLMSGNSEVDGIYKSSYDGEVFSEPERLPETVNVKQGSFDGVISPDGSYYIVNVYGKEDGYGETDLYVSFKEGNENWTPLKNLGPKINTNINEGSARITADGQYIFFSGILGNQNFYSDNPTYEDILNSRTKPLYGNYDIYWVSAKIIEEYRQKKLNSNNSK